MSEDRTSIHHTPSLHQLVSSIYPVVSDVTDSLTDLELNAVYQAAELRTDPRHAPWYKKVEILFDEYDGKYMHELTLATLRVVWKRRFKSKIS